MKILHLILTYKWYEAIRVEGKREEYRALSDYWSRRLVDPNMRPVGLDLDYARIDKYCANQDPYQDFHISQERHNYYSNIPKKYDAVCFHKGYTNTTMTFRLKRLSLGYGRTEWGAPANQEVFILSLGKRI